MKEELTLFDCSFSSKKLYQDALYEIGGFETESDIVKHMCNTELNNMQDFIIQVIQSINLRSSTKINLDEIYSKVFEFLFFKEECSLLNSTSEIEKYLIQKLGEKEAHSHISQYTEQIEIDGITVNIEYKSIRHKDAHAITIEKLCNFGNIILPCLNSKAVGTDEGFSEYQVQQAILNTLENTKDNTKEEDSFFILVRQKMEVEGRNQYMKRLSGLMIDANVNYVLKDNDDKFFYPFIANLFFAYNVTRSTLEKYSGLFKALNEVQYESNKLGEDIIKIDKDVKKAYLFHKDVRKDQIWKYISTVYADRYSTNFSSMSKLIKFFIYERPKNYNKSLAEPTDTLPDPLTNLDTFTQSI